MGRPAMTCELLARAQAFGIEAEQVDGQDVRAVYEAAAREEGKPEAALSKIVDGRVAGYYKTNCLLEQTWVKDGKETGAALLDEAASRLSEKIAVGRFVRYRVGQS